MRVPVALGVTVVLGDCVGERDSLGELLGVRVWLVVCEGVVVGVGVTLLVRLCDGELLRVCVDVDDWLAVALGVDVRVVLWERLCVSE